LAEQGIAVFRSTFGKMGHKFLDVLARGFAKSFAAAEVDGVRLHQIRIELVLADELAEAITNPAAVPISTMTVAAIARLGGSLANWTLMTDRPLD
jgi:hypothetical protein